MIEELKKTLAFQILTAQKILRVPSSNPLNTQPFTTSKVAQGQASVSSQGVSLLNNCTNVTINVTGNGSMPAMQEAAGGQRLGDLSTYKAGVERLDPHRTRQRDQARVGFQLHCKYEYKNVHALLICFEEDQDGS